MWLWERSVWHFAWFFSSARLWHWSTSRKHAAVSVFQYRIFTWMSLHVNKTCFFHLVMADGNFIQLVKQTCLQTHLKYQEITTRRYRGALVFNLESNICSSFAFYLRGNKRLFTCLSPTVTAREWQIWKLLCLTFYSLWIILIFGSNITSGITLLRMCHFFSLMCSANYVLMQISNQPVI